MRKELIINIINCILQDIKDRAFISASNRCINNMNEEYKQDKDVKLLQELLTTILDEGVCEEKEALYIVSQTEFSDEIKVSIDDHASYS